MSSASAVVGFLGIGRPPEDFELNGVMPDDAAVPVVQNSSRPVQSRIKHGLRRNDLPASFSRLRRRRRTLVIALLIRTRDHWTGFEVLLHQEFVAAARALLGNRLVGRREFALRVIRATVECIAFAGALLNQFPVLAKRAFHSDEVLLYELAFRIARTGGEFAVAPVSNHQVASAFRAGLIERDVGYAFALVEPPGSLAIRISGARHELAETAAFQHHHPATVLAILFLRRLLHVGRIEIG